MLYSDYHSALLAVKHRVSPGRRCMSAVFDLLLVFFLMEDHSDITAAISIPETYLEKISDQAIVSHLENWSLWVLVDGNNSLNKKKTCLAPNCVE